MSSHPSSQSQSVEGSSISGQIGQAVRELNQFQEVNQTSQLSSELTLLEVVDLLTQIQKAIQDANLPSDIEEKVGNYIGAAKAEIQEKESDKLQVSKNLKRATETLKATGQTIEEAKNVWSKIQPLLLPVVEWINISKKIIGL